jgi:phosphoribosylglycinamide formyltransferase-1
MINTHPSLLPKHGGRGMYGVRVQEAVLASGDTMAGCTVHYVDESIDGGEIILQHSVAVRDRETAWDLGGRIFLEENRLLVRAIELIMSKRGEPDVQVE